MQFIWLCFKRAVSRSLRVADGIYSGIGLTIILVIKDWWDIRLPYSQAINNMILFLSIFGIVLILRFITAPYFLWKEAQKKIAILEQRNFRSKKSENLKAFVSFLDKKIVEGQKIWDSKLKSNCYSFDIQDNPLIDDEVKKFEIPYKKWRKKVDEGCKQALSNQREMPFNEGELPELAPDSRQRCDYRKFLERDIQYLKDLKTSTRKEDVHKKLK